MRRFIYFIPNVPGCNREMLESRGLLSRFTSPGGLIAHGVTAWRDGPGGNGVAVAVTGEPPVYSPDSQIWIEGATFWTGMAAEDRPRPDDVEREIGYNGHSIRLLDGNMWRVPLIRRWDSKAHEHVSALPKVLKPVHENGRMNLKRCVSPQHEKIDALADGIWQAFLSKMVWDIEALFTTAVALLSQNYHVGIEEASLLGLLDEETALKLVGLAIDAPGLDRAAIEAAEDGLHFREEVTRG